MTNELLSLAHLTDAAVIDEVTRRAAEERQSTTWLVAALAELDARRLYLAQGCSSLFTYCTRVLHLSEHAAYGRIEAARAARKYPVLLEMLAAGDVTLTAVGLLVPHLTAENHRDLLSRAKRKTKREVEELVASVRPLPDVQSTIRKQPTPGARASSSAGLPATAGSSATVTTPTQPGGSSVTSSNATPAPAAHWPVVAPLAPERFKVQITVSRETIDTLRRVQDLMRHVVPDGDPAVIFDRALRVLLEDLEKRRLAATAHPGVGAKPVLPNGRQQSGRTRYIPAGVRRVVWKRDGGRCAFVGAVGRCAETGWIEFHHVRPFADGGDASAENIELRCRAHNQYEAELMFGARMARERHAPFDVDSVWTEFAGERPEPLWSQAGC